MSSGRNSIGVILFEGRAQNNPDAHDFLKCGRPGRKPLRNPGCSGGLSAAELAAGFDVGTEEALTDVMNTLMMLKQLSLVE